MPIIKQMAQTFFEDIEKIFNRLHVLVRALIVSLALTLVTFLIYSVMVYFTFISVRVRMPWIFMFLLIFIIYYLYDTIMSMRKKKLYVEMK